jgi:hypothetical protein
MLGLALILPWGEAAQAQVNPAIVEATLRQPWEQQLAVLESLADSIATAPDAKARAARADSLATLQVAIGEYEAQVDRVIDRIVADPQFAYIAAETSEALGAKVAEIHARLDALYTELGVQGRDDVRKAQGALDELAKILLAKSGFERDVTFVVHSLSREQIVAFATRWWNGEERAIAVKKLVARLRERLEQGQ